MIFFHGVGANSTGPCPKSIGNQPTGQTADVADEEPTFNIQHSTSNIEDGTAILNSERFREFNTRTLSVLNVGFWMLDVDVSTSRHNGAFRIDAGWIQALKAAEPKAKPLVGGKGRKVTAGSAS